MESLRSFVSFSGREILSKEKTDRATEEKSEVSQGQAIEVRLSIAYCINLEYI